MVWHFWRRWHAATSVLSSSSFYQDTGSNGLGFLENFRNTIYLQITLVTSGTKLSLKLKTKTEVSLCGITNTSIKRK